MSVIKLVKNTLFFIYNDFHLESYAYNTYNTAAGDLYSVGGSSFFILTCMNF
jgi:hypothetical protein